MTVTNIRMVPAPPKDTKIVPATNKDHKITKFPSTFVR